MEPIIPFEPMITNDIPAGEQWIAQVKWDGTRMLTYCQNGQVKLYNRKLNERTKQYPEIHNYREYCRTDSFIFDGEMIALQDGKPSFYNVMKRDRIRKIANLPLLVAEVPIIYMVFDLLYCNGKWIVDQPLSERQAMLAEVLLPNAAVQMVESFSDKLGLYQACMDKELEGVVFKNLTSAYTIGGKDARWLKRKKESDLIAYVGGVSYRGNVVNSLDLGIWNKENEFVYIGSAGGGKLSVRDWKDVTHAVQQIIQFDSPFSNYRQPETNLEHHWIQPVLQVKVAFLEWTQSHTLRQPIIQAFV
ncbi:DNA ligase [Cytobacillus horneckiae]|uniref:ATP-dependent DNA ligase n=1 Tax=Cytobacillus horneckiae TaxID=549687 RepID=UPI003D9AA67B